MLHELSNGRRTLCWDEEGLYRMPAQGEGQRCLSGYAALVNVKDGDLRLLSWSSDSQWLYFIGSRRSPFIDIYRIPAGTPNPEVNGLSYNQRFVWLGQRFRKPILEPILAGRRFFFW